MHHVLLSLGTNTHARFNLKCAMQLLELHFQNVRFTSVVKSNPYGTQYNRPFLNTLAFFHTSLKQEELAFQLKNMEQKMGRKPEDKSNGKIIIDIDLIMWDNEIVKPEDFKRSYVRELLPQVDWGKVNS